MNRCHLTSICALLGRLSGISCCGGWISRAHCNIHHPSMCEGRSHNEQCLPDVGIKTHPDLPMDVIVAGQRHAAKEHVIFFGGDVQDYPDNMLSHRDNGKYIQWNILATAGRLCERFPAAMVMVVKPHHMHLKTFSVYSQFVQSNDFGVPIHPPEFGAWKRLQETYDEVLGIALAGETSPDKFVEDSSNSAVKQEQRNNPKTSASQDIPIHLIGFSKGCIVLNQLVYELGYVQTKREPSVDRFVSGIAAMTWLDGGHSGGNNTWVTEPGAVQRLAQLKVKIQVHVTPYQVKDDMRRWIGREQRKFVELLRKAGADVTDTLHFKGEPKSIENHFRVLEVF